MSEFDSPFNFDGMIDWDKLEEKYGVTNLPSAPNCDCRMSTDKMPTAEEMRVMAAKAEMDRCYADLEMMTLRELRCDSCGRFVKVKLPNTVRVCPHIFRWMRDAWGSEEGTFVPRIDGIRVEIIEEQEDE